MNSKLKAQSLTEYALVIALVSAGLIGMQVYVKRGIQAKVKNFVDGSVKESARMAGRPQLSQYEPYYTDSSFIVAQSQKSAVTYNPGGTIRREFSSADNNSSREGTVISRGISPKELTADDGWEE
ncbi:hypothetical protein EPN16_03240 [bacterium]|nr:MAG: hypothetical protein EPN16_03240 [bacterium]